MKTRFGSTLLVAAASVALGACGEDGDVIVPVEPQSFEVTVENVTAAYQFPTSGVFNTPIGETMPGPLLPGGIYEFTVSAPPGARLSFATMFVQSNDWFYAPDGGGIELWDALGNQVSGDVTDQLYLWDAGSEEDQEPGIGADQAPRQGAANSGAADDDTTVRLAADSWGNIPATTSVISATIEPIDGTTFRVRIENVSDAMTLTASDMSMHPVPLAPGVWVVHTTDDPFFTDGSDERGEGLAALAEDGDASGLFDSVADETGIVGPIAPGVFAVHSAPSALFMAGMADTGLGLEALAEDGDPSGLAAALSGNSTVSLAGAFDTPDGGSGAAPAFPGEGYTFEVTAEPGDRLSFATMYVQSNDLFFAPAEGGLDLFPGGSALDGDVTGMVLLWDAGTELNERPGIGLYQAPRQTGADMGQDEGGVVRQVNDGYEYPDVSEVIRVTVRPIG